MYQNQGYGKEATNLLIDFCFGKLGMHKIKIGIFGFNFISMKLADYFGFTIEGILKEEVYKNGKYEDLIKYRLFNYEWDSNRGK